MSSRGPLSEARKSAVRAEARLNLGGTLKLPDGLSAKARKLFRALNRDLAAAGVGLRQADAHALAAAAETLARLTERDLTPELFARHTRDLQQWLAALGATPASRARLGLPAPQPRRELSEAEKAIEAIAGPTFWKEKE